MWMRIIAVECQLPAVPHVGSSRASRETWQIYNVQVCSMPYCGHFSHATMWSIFNATRHANAERAPCINAPKVCNKHTFDADVLHLARRIKTHMLRTYYTSHVSVCDLLAANQMICFMNCSVCECVCEIYLLSTNKEPMHIRLNKI